MRTNLAAQLARQEEVVAAIRRTVEREQADVDRLGRGVMGFLNELLGGQLTREQAELAQAAAQLHEAVAMRDSLRGQIAAYDQRIAQLAGVEQELATLRADKERALLASDSPVKAQLDDLEIQMMSIDIELVPVHEAVVAGHAALAELAELVALIESLADEATSARKRTQLGRGAIGETNAKLTTFEAELTDLAAFQIEVSPGDPTDRDLDHWLATVIDDRGDRATRITAARGGLGERIARLRARLEPVRKRHDELAARRQALSNQRADLIARS